MALKRLRRNNGFTQGDLARRLGVSRQAVCMWEADKRIPGIKMLKKIAMIFEVTVDEIVMLQEITAAKKEGNMNMITRDRISGAARRKVEFQITAPSANLVRLAGDFNSWNESGIRMKKDKNGIWKTEISLKPGKYEYKFIVDGQWWNDPSNSDTITNGFGSLNSVKEVNA